MPQLRPSTAQKKGNKNFSKIRMLKSEWNLERTVTHQHLSILITWWMGRRVGEIFVQSFKAATAKSLQLCLTLCDPIDGSPPGSPVPGILLARTLEWLPFPSPMHESEKWKWSRSVMLDSLWPHGLQPTSLLHPWDFPGKNTGVGCHCLLLTCCNSWGCKESDMTEWLNWTEPCVIKK